MKQTFPDHRAWATISLSALERNLQSIRSALPSHLRFVSVVKANAYGHGLAPVVTRLMRANADAFAVANLEEARKIQEVGEGWPILVLSALLPSEYSEAIRLKVIPVVSSVGEIQGLDSASKKYNTLLQIHLKIDTGMGRLGVWWEDLLEVFEAIKAANNIQLVGLCTHFSSADSDEAFTKVQRARFLKCLQAIKSSSEVNFSNALIHADNSAGMETFPLDGPFNAARIGLLQFGIRPHQASLLAEVPVDPVLSFYARVGLTKFLPAETPISYGKTFYLKKRTRIAVLTAGYADGIPTALSNNGKVIIRGQLCPVIGRVTMDQTIVDVSHIPNPPQPGDVACFIGAMENCRITISDFSKSSNRIEWESLCGISARTKRLYLSDSLAGG